MKEVKNAIKKNGVKEVAPLPLGPEERGGTVAVAAVEANGGNLPVRTVETVTLEIVTLKHQAGRVLMGYAIEIGRRLVEVKELLPHGSWGDYLKTSVEYSQSTAENFMKLFREYGVEQQSMFGAEANSQTLANLPYSKALALLALPVDEREAFAEENDLEAMSTRQLQEALRAKEEAEADAKNAEASRASMEDSLKTANAHMETAREEAENAQRAQEEAERQAAELRAKLEELEKRPIDVAVEAADPAELERAREEGRQSAEAELKEKLEAADRDKAAAEKAREDLAAARQKAKEAEEATKHAQAAAEAAQKDAEKLKKALEAASNKEIAAFQVYFDNTQKDFTMMIDQLGKLKKAGDKEAHDKLVGALGALVAALGGQVPEKMGSEG